MGSVSLCLIDLQTKNCVRQQAAGASSPRCLAEVLTNERAKASLPSSVVNTVSFCSKKNDFSLCSNSELRNHKQCLFSNGILPKQPATGIHGNFVSVSDGQPCDGSPGRVVGTACTRGWFECFSVTYMVI